MTFFNYSHPSQCNGGCSQAHEASFAAVGVGGEGEVMLQGVDDLLDVAGVIGSDQVLHSPFWKQHKQQQQQQQRQKQQ